jgi:4-hydroxy-4-methyl-2-oxoglutarate aldolase
MFQVNPMPAPIDADLIARLSATSAGTFGHVMDEGFMDSGILCQTPESRIVGTAVTVRVTVPDSSIAHYALKFLRAGDILVIDRGPDQHVACWGTMTALSASKIGVRGVVIDGAGHDITGSNRIGFPTWCRRVTPMTTKYRALGGALNVPISCGGVSVHPGDAILADANGVLVLPRARIDAALALAEPFESRKRLILDTIARDPAFCVPDASGATKIVETALKRQAGG